MTYSRCVFVLSLMPSRALKGVLGNIGIPHKDKVIHFVMYGVLGFIVLWALRLKSAKSSLLLKVILGCFLYGALMEFLQLSVVPGTRDFSWMDMAANGLGAGTATVLFATLRKPWERSR